MKWTSHFDSVLSLPSLCVRCIICERTLQGSSRASSYRDRATARFRYLSDISRSTVTMWPSHEMPSLQNIWIFGRLRWRFLSTGIRTDLCLQLDRMRCFGGGFEHVCVIGTRTTQHSASLGNKGRNAHTKRVEPACLLTKKICTKFCGQEGSKRFQGMNMNTGEGLFCLLLKNILLHNLAYWFKCRGKGFYCFV